jgi:hypothetical protein
MREPDPRLPDDVLRKLAEITRVPPSDKNLERLADVVLILLDPEPPWCWSKIQAELDGIAKASRVFADALEKAPKTADDFFPGERQKVRRLAEFAAHVLTESELAGRDIVAPDAPPGAGRIRDFSTGWNISTARSRPWAGS